MSPQKTPPTARAGSRDDPANPIPEAEGGGERWRLDGRRFSQHAGESYRHVARGSTYTLPFGRAEAALQTSEPIEDGAVLIVYIGEDGMIWARPTHEFFDGRFALSSEAPPVVCGGEDGSSGGRAEPEPCGLRTETLSPAGERRGIGWLYVSDDGIEWSANHPVTSGEVPDARLIRRASNSALLAALKDAWEAHADAIQSEGRLRDRLGEAEARARAAVVPAAEQAGGWRPIGSAPRNEAGFLYGPLGYGIGGVTRYEPRAPNSEPYEVVKVAYAERDGRHLSVYLPSHRPGEQPTHWMPFPLPPPDHDAIPSAEGGSGNDTREAIARIIAPADWGNHDRYLVRHETWGSQPGEEPGQSYWQNSARQCVRCSLATADQILALLQSPRGEA